MLMLQMNVFLLVGLFAVCVVLGFRFRNRQLTSLKKQVAELEHELRLDHADIHELKRESRQ
jgi:hypothetical protein